RDYKVTGVQTCALPICADPSNEARSISDEVKEATDALARGQIAVYPVDVRGLVVTGTSASDVSNRSQASSSNSADFALNARHMTDRKSVVEGTSVGPGE